MAITFLLLLFGFFFFGYYLFNEGKKETHRIDTLESFQSEKNLFIKLIKLETEIGRASNGGSRKDMPAKKCKKKRKNVNAINRA